MKRFNWFYANTVSVYIEIQWYSNTHADRDAVMNQKNIKYVLLTFGYQKEAQDI